MVMFIFQFWIFSALVIVPEASASTFGKSPYPWQGFMKQAHLCGWQIGVPIRKLMGCKVSSKCSDR